MASRFARLAQKLETKGAKNPKALAAWIGVKKYGQKRMTQMSVTGRRSSAKR